MACRLTGLRRKAFPLFAENWDYKAPGLIDPKVQPSWSTFCKVLLIKVHRVVGNGHMRSWIWEISYLRFDALSFHALRDWSAVSGLNASALCNKMEGKPQIRCLSCSVYWQFLKPPVQEITFALLSLMPFETDTSSGWKHWFWPHPGMPRPGHCYPAVASGLLCVSFSVETPCPTLDSTHTLFTSTSPVSSSLSLHS